MELPQPCCPLKSAEEPVKKIREAARRRDKSRPQRPAVHSWRLKYCGAADCARLHRICPPTQHTKTGVQCSIALRERLALFRPQPPGASGFLLRVAKGFPQYKKESVRGCVRWFFPSHPPCALLRPRCEYPCDFRAAPRPT